MILWDVDATLIRQGPFTKILIEATLESLRIETPVQGLVAKVIEGAQGKTDGQLVGELMAACGLVPRQISDTMIQEALRHYEQQLANECRWGSKTLALPGADAALERLAYLGFRQALLTTCTAQAALIKLENAGLDRHFRNAGGASGLNGTFCAGRQGRDQLMRQARVAYGNAPLVYIADSVLDMHSGRGIGAHCVAVRSGAVSDHDLVAAGARQVITSRAQLECIDSFLEFDDAAAAAGDPLHLPIEAAAPRIVSRAGIRLDDLIAGIELDAVQAPDSQGPDSIDSTLSLDPAPRARRPTLPRFGSWFSARR